MVDYYCCSLDKNEQIYGHRWNLNMADIKCTVCPRSLGPFHIESYYIKWDKTSWTGSMFERRVD